MGRKAREVWVKLFGFKVGDNVLLKRETWRKKRYGVITYREGVSLFSPKVQLYSVHFGKVRAEKHEWEYKKAEIFKEEEMEIDEIQRVKTIEEYQAERKRQEKWLDRYIYSLKIS